MLDVSKKDILPAVSAYTKSLADTAAAKKAVSADIDCSYETETLAKISGIEACMFAKTAALERAVIEAKETVGMLETANYYKDHVIPAMNELRVNADEAGDADEQSLLALPVLRRFAFWCRVGLTPAMRPI